mgnify:FL=1
MRYYLDTNILVYLITKDKDSLSREVYEIISDYSNQRLTSSVCVHEIIQLCQIGKIYPRKKENFSAQDIFKYLDEFDIDIVYTNKKHLETMAAMPVLHNDPYDRLIIAQSISDRITVISSDRMFRNYRKHGLGFVYNER